MIKICKGHYYKTIFLKKMKNPNTPESSENSSPPRSFQKKNFLKLALVKSLKKNTIKTLKRKNTNVRENSESLVTLIKVFKEKILRGPYSSLI